MSTYNRVTVLVDGSGRTTAIYNRYYSNRDAFRIALYNLSTRGFTPLYTLRIPKRNMARGWNPFYTYFLRWAVHNLGI